MRPSSPPILRSSFRTICPLGTGSRVRCGRGSGFFFSGTCFLTAATASLRPGASRPRSVCAPARMPRSGSSPPARWLRSVCAPV
eukprot:578287-Rhodomonas_salina.1